MKKQSNWMKMSGGSKSFNRQLLKAEHLVIEGPAGIGKREYKQRLLKLLRKAP